MVFDRLLRRESDECPEEWLLSRLCEEFPGCLPSQLEDEPLRPLLRILEYRGYARALQTIEDHAAAMRAGTAKPDDLPTGPMIDMVFEVQGEKIRMAEEELGNNG